MPPMAADMGADQPPVQLMDLVQEMIAMTLRGELLPDFLHQILGDIYKACHPAKKLRRFVFSRKLFK